MSEQDTTTPVEARIAELSAEIQHRSAEVQRTIDFVKDENRDLGVSEQRELRRHRDRIVDLRANLAAAYDAKADEEARTGTAEEQTQRRLGQIDAAMTRSASAHSPLLVSAAHLRSHAEAIAHGSTFGAVELFERAQVTVSTDTGSPGDWAGGSIPEPVTLRRFAGIPAAKATGATAQMPSVTLPTGVAGVAESVAHTEFDALAVVNLTVLRYGRWTDVTSFVDEFTTLNAINGAHAVGIARDLNLLDLTAIQTAAGSVTAYSATALDLNVRAAILKVAAATMSEPEECVLFGTSAAMAVVNGYSPVTGGDRGTTTVRVYGAKCYVTEQATAGNVYAFAPKGFQVFQSGLASASVIDPTTGGHKFGQWLHTTAPGVFIVGAAAGVDVVTP